MNTEEELLKAVIATAAEENDDLGKEISGLELRVNDIKRKMAANAQFIAVATDRMKMKSNGTTAPVENKQEKTKSSNAVVVVEGKSEYGWLSKGIKNYLNRNPGKTFTIQELADALKIQFPDQTLVASSIYGNLTKLIKSNHVEEVEKGAGRNPGKYKSNFF